MDVYDYTDIKADAEYYQGQAHYHYSKGHWAEARTAALIAANLMLLWVNRP